MLRYDVGLNPAARAQLKRLPFAQTIVSLFYQIMLLLLDIFLQVSIFKRKTYDCCYYELFTVYPHSILQ